MGHECKSRGAAHDWRFGGLQVRVGDSGTSAAADAAFEKRCRLVSAFGSVAAPHPASMPRTGA